MSTIIYHAMGDCNIIEVQYRSFLVGYRSKELYSTSANPHNNLSRRRSILYNEVSFSKSMYTLQPTAAGGVYRLVHDHFAGCVIICDDDYRELENAASRDYDKS